MEKRIKIIWTLSILSSLLVIAMQAYWIYNQYIYTIGQLSEELYGKIAEAVEEEYMIRQKQRNPRYYMSIMREYDTRENEDIDLSSPNRLQFSFNANPADSIELGYIKLSTRMPEDVMAKAVNKWLIDKYISFESERMDSLLCAILPSTIQYEFQLYTVEDTAKLEFEKVSSEQMKNLDLNVKDNPHQVDSVEWDTWKQISGSLWNPQITVNYPYNILDKKRLEVVAWLPVPVIFNRFSSQLIISFVLILLLSGCLIYQIQTILKQKKLGELQLSYVNTMLHELKRPVQALKMLISFLKNEDMRKDENIADQVVEDSIFELDKLSLYLAKLKDMTQLEESETLLKKSHFDMKGIVDKSIHSIRNSAHKEVDFTIHIGEGAEEVNGDPIHLANVFSNLIENAIKYSKEQVAIVIDAFRRGNSFVLEVSDNGIGIPLNEQDKVFGKFYRASNHPDKDIPGMGLGLSYVKLIAEAHQGKVELKSRPGIGTTVSIEIPQ